MKHYLYPLLFSFFILKSCNNQPSFSTIQSPIFYSKGSSNAPIDISKNLQDIPIIHDQIDYALLIHLIHKLTNEFRAEKKLQPLVLDPILEKTALLQNDYIVERQELSHTQSHQNTQNLLDRVQLFEGKYQSVGENLQMLGFTLITKGKKQTIQTFSYELAAEEILDNWVASPPHYENLIQANFNKIGTGIALSPDKKSLFVTQVYGFERR